MMTAAQVSRLYGIAKIGKIVFNDQIVSIGPSAITATINTAQKITFIQSPTC